MGAIIGGPGRFGEVVARFVASDEYDAILAVTSADPPAHTGERVDGLVALDTDKPLVHLWMAGDLGAAGRSRLQTAGKAVLEEPRAAMLALAAVVRRAQLLEELDGTVPPPAGERPTTSRTEHNAKRLLAG